MLFDDDGVVFEIGVEINLKVVVKSLKFGLSLASNSRRVSCF